MSIFDRIAPIYGMFFNFQVRYFKKIRDRAYHEIDIKKYDSVLDIGCGTGALCKTLADDGLSITGVDTSVRMLNQARKKLKDSRVELIHIDPDDRLPFEDKSFDLVITSYVAHGLQREERLELYREMRRIARKTVVIHDYNKERALLTTVIEWLERGDYFNFIKIAKEEMETIFEQVREINVDKRASWYICYCKNKGKENQDI